MDMVLQILSLLVSGGIVGQLLFYNSRKRKEAAAAQKEEDANALAYAQEWRNLYTHEHEEHMEERTRLNNKIDSLYDDIGKQRDLIRELQWNECTVNGCMKRKPPRDYGKAETD